MMPWGRRGNKSKISCLDNSFGFLYCFKWLESPAIFIISFAALSLVKSDILISFLFNLVSSRSSSYREIMINLGLAVSSSSFFKNLLNFCLFVLIKPWHWSMIITYRWFYILLTMSSFLYSNLFSRPMNLTLSFLQSDYISPLLVSFFAIST